MSALRRFVVLGAVLLAVPMVEAQPAVDVLSLPTDARAGRHLDAARDYIAARDWETATDALQRLLDREDDVFVLVTRKGADGREVRIMASARNEARSVLATLPPDGREYYRLKYGTVAARLLTDARDDKDVARLAAIAGRFPLTEAAVEALNDAAALTFEAGHVHLAGAYHRKLLDVRPAEKWSDAVLFQAAVTARRIGGNASAFDRELLRRAADKGVRVGDTVYKTEELKAELVKRGRPDAASDWRMVGGNVSRSAAAVGSPPILEKNWSVPRAEMKSVANWIDKATDQFKQRGDAIIPAAEPIAQVIQGRSIVYFKDTWGLHAYDIATGQRKFKTPADGSLGRLLSQNQFVNTMEQVLDSYITQRTRPGIIFENSVTGTLSTDGRLIFVVDDLDVPYPSPLEDRFGPGQFPNKLNKDFKDMVLCNRLRAYQADRGKLIFEVGGLQGEITQPLHETIFLGPPLPLDGRLYILAERKQQLRLVVLDAATGKMQALHILGTPREALANDPVRRTQAAHLAYGEGVLVCPTNTGAILGVDVLSGALLWMHAYDRPEPAPQPPAPPGRPPIVANMTAANDMWKVSAPVVRAGKVVFAASDSRSVRCLNLHDGSLIWSDKRRDDDLYLAGVHGDRVVVVGKKSVRGLSLDKGEVVWTLETGLPSGRGAFSDDGLYYLPLEKSAKDGDAGVAVLDVAKGTLRSFVRSPNQEKPGNLVFFDGVVASQSVTALTVYPQLQKKLEEIDNLLKKNAPNDPTALTERGGLRLYRGDLAGAVEDLRNALANKPDKAVRLRAREKLYTALTEYLRRDFNAAEKYLKEYEELLTPEKEPDAPEAEKKAAEAEQRRRRQQYFVIVGLGREGQGKAVEALKAYVSLATMSGGELLAAPEQPELRVVPAVWARARVAAVLAKVEEKQRKDVDAEIAQRIDAAREAKNFETLLALADLFDDLPAGREARFQVVEHLLTQRNYLEADLHLQRLRRSADRTIAARAVEGLARLHMQRGTLAEAVHYYQILARDFGAVVVRDGKTGKAIFEELQTDKRLLPFLKEQERFPTRLKIEEERVNVAVQPSYELRHIGEALPLFRDNRFFVSTATSALAMSSPDGKVVWSQNLSRTVFPSLSFYHTPGFSFPFATLGHIIYLPLGQKVFALDPIDKRVLWKRELHAVGPQGNEPQFAPVVDTRDGGVLLTYSDGWIQRAGRLPAIGPAAVCLHTQQGLLGLHPLTGEVLWQRGALPNRCNVWGDDRHVCVVETNHDGTAAATHVYRLADGTAVQAPDFSAAYDRRLRMIGASLLVSEPAGKDEPRLHLYNPAAGKDVWTRTIPVGAKVLSSVDPELTGFAARDGQVVVLETVSSRDLFMAKMIPEHVQKAVNIHVLADERFIYLGCEDPPDANRVVTASGMSVGNGWRSVFVDGAFYSFDRATGRLRMRHSIPGQYLLVDPTGVLPVLVFTSRDMRTGVGMPQPTQVFTCTVLDKVSGKRLYDNDSMERPERTLPLPTANVFHSLTVDAANRRIELTGTLVRLTMVPGEQK
jgi:outer membrane protein assembly factor BamB/tetratricopeptide (TPR) repeat protein